MLPYGLAILMLLQSASGLLFAEQYRDAEWIRATWFGNDWVTLVLATPLLALSQRASRRGSPRARLMVLGVVGYGIYNYAFYLLGAALNPSFPLYLAAVVGSAFAMISGASRSQIEDIASHFSPTTPVRLIGGYLAFVATGLSVVWLSMWAAHVFAGRPTPVEPEAFRLVAALDLSLMVPSLIAGGLLLWRRRPLGFVVASIAGIQASLYLLVLSINSLVAIDRGLTQGAGELPLWGSLFVPTTIVTALLLRCAPTKIAPAP